MATKDPSDPGLTESDRQWFDRLRGQPGVVTDAQAIAEADALKLALQMEREAELSDAELQATLTEEALQRQWEQLQFRARREGLLGTAPGHRRRFLPALGGLAAAMALAAVLVPLLLPPGIDDTGIDGPPPVLRGDVQSLRKTLPDPAGKARILTKELRAAGFRPGLYRRDKTYVVDVDIPPARLTEAIPAFRRLSLEPKPGLVRVELEAP